MTRARPGTPAPRGRGKKERNVLRNVPPVSARRGVNGQKTDKDQRERARARRTGTLRRIWNVFRTVMAALLVTGALGAAGWAGWQAYESHGMLALRQVDVVGNRLVDKAAILEKAGLELGVKLPMIKVGKVEAALLDLPGIGKADVRRIFPSRIEIRIQEKEPVAMGYARGWHGLAPDGTRIAGLDWGQSDLPVVDGFAALDAAARSALGTFLDGARREYPSLYANFSQLSWRGPDGVEIILRDRRLKVLLALDQGLPAAPKATNPGSNKSLISLEFLQALQQQQAAALEPGMTVDLRVEGFAYVR
jgi:hypothetical protein